MKIRQNLGRTSTYLNKYGMTSEQLHASLTNKDKNKEEPIKRVKGGRTSRLKVQHALRKNPGLLDVVGLANTPYFKLSSHTEYYSPPWFKKIDKADISIIVPLYESNLVIKDQIESWDLDDSLNVEIIYVDDACPKNSKDMIIPYWDHRLKNNKRPIGKIIYASRNNGYGGACNIGSFYATGRYLIFLNADTTVTPGWIAPLIGPLKDLNIGIVGNLQLKEGGAFHGMVDSAGSEWSWNHNCFVHIGRHIYNGNDLPKPFKVEEMPDDLKVLSERDMVTGCCFSIRRDLFKQIGGFNPNYRRGYWEDAELCMSVKEKGYKIFYQPKSIINHKLSHSALGQHNFMKHNIEYFSNKWVRSGRIDDLVGQKREKPVISSILLRRTQANGDVLFAASVAPALKKKYPGVKIYFSTAAEALVRNNPYIDGVIEDYEKQARFYQIFYDLDMCYEYRPYSNIMETYADAVGVSVKDCKLFIHTEKPEFNLPERYAVVHAGQTNWVGRNWKIERWQEIANRLKNEGLDVILVGTDKDNFLVNTIDCRGRTSFNHLAYVIKNAVVFAGINSFPMHLAQTFDVPSVVFFGSVNAENWIVSENTTAVKANDLECLSCHQRKPLPCFMTAICERGDLACEEQVDVNMFWEQLKIRLKQ